MKVRAHTGDSTGNTSIEITHGVQSCAVSGLYSVYRQSWMPSELPLTEPALGDWDDNQHFPLTRQSLRKMSWFLDIVLGECDLQRLLQLADGHAHHKAY